MLSYLYYILGYENNEYNENNKSINEDKNESEDEYIDKEIINIKLNLKKVRPKQKKFYCPSIKELNMEINKRQNKKNFLESDGNIDQKKINLEVIPLTSEDEEIKKSSIYMPNKEELIKSKNNLRKCKKKILLKKTFTDELKFAKLNLKKTTINHRIENFCHTYLDKFEKDKKNRKYRNYVVTI